MVAGTVPLILDREYPAWIQRLFLLLRTQGSEIFIRTSTWGGDRLQQNAVVLMGIQGLLKPKFKNKLYEETITITVYATDLNVQEHL